MLEYKKAHTEVIQVYKVVYLCTKAVYELKQCMYPLK